MCRRIISTLLRDLSEDFGISKFARLFSAQIGEGWGHGVSGLVLGYDQNALLDSIIITLENGQLDYRQPIHNPTSVEFLGLDWVVEYTTVNQGIMPKAHNIWVQYMQRGENDLDNTVQGQILYFAVLHFSWTPPNEILQFPECLPAGKP